MALWRPLHQLGRRCRECLPAGAWSCTLPVLCPVARRGGCHNPFGMGKDPQHPRGPRYPLDYLVIGATSPLHPV